MICSLLFSECRAILLWNKRVTITLSEQLAHSAVDLHLKEISEFLHGSEMNENPTLQYSVRDHVKSSTSPKKGNLSQRGEGGVLKPRYTFCQVSETLVFSIDIYAICNWI